MASIKRFFERIASSPEKKVLVENFFSLSFLQVANYFLPLLTLPYLVRVLGPEKFGLIAFAQAFIQYFVIVTDYGFKLSATREISINREDKNKVSEIFSSVMLIKLGLTMFSFVVLISLVFALPKFRNDWLIYLFSFGIVMGNVLFPVWFFQGMERMKYVTFLNIAAKLIFTISIFVFIRNMEDYIYVPLITSLGFLVAGVVGLWIIHKNFGVKFTLPNFESIKHQLKEGWHIFISTMSISLYTTSNTFILGLLTNNTIVGYYSAAEKLIKAVQGLLAPVSQTVYPYISRLANESKQRALNFIRKLVTLVGSGSFIISLAIFIFATPIVNIVLGHQYQESIIILKILAFLPFIIGLSNIFAVQGLYAFEFQWAVPRFVIPIGLLHLFLLFILTYFYSLIGTATATIITEALITVFSIRYFSKFILKGEKAL